MTRIHHRPPVRSVCHALLALGIAAASARAADSSQPYSLENDFPLRVEDAHPLDVGDSYLKLVARYTEEPDGSGVTNVQPEVAFGFAKNLDLHVMVPNYIGDGDRTGSGDANVNVQWLFHYEQPGDPWPALAIEGDVILPTGSVDNSGLDTIIEFIATKTLIGAPAFDEVHVNLSWLHNAGDDANQERRDDGYTAIFGYSRRIADETVFVTDVYWEQQLDQHQAGQALEVGLIRELGEHVELSAGVGVSLGDDAPDYTATVGVIFQR